MKKAVVYGFCSNLVNSLDWLREAGICEAVAWFSNMPNASHPLNLYTYCKFSKEGFYGYEQTVHDYVRSFLPIYLDMASRIDVFYEYDFHDYVNIFNKTFDYFYHLLTTEKIELVIFTSLPHVGDDWILYLTAQALGIKTLTFYQSLFPNKFFYTFNLDDFGYFDHIPAMQPFEHHAIEKKHEKEIFYMKNVKRPKLTYKDILLHLRYRKFNLFMPRYKRFRTYEKMYTRYANTAVNFSEPYVYFPLHLQPELTTSTLGDKYADQLLAIEHLSKLLPPGWFIYLKENPIQTEFMRGRFFWERIKILPNVKFVPIETNTHQLIQHSQFVATITGTAGWEAITGGKNVLVFGRPWYLTLPGVFRYQDGVSLDTLVNQPIDHAKLEEAFSRLCQKMGGGMVSEDYKPLMPGFDPAENEQMLARTLKQILQETSVPVAAC
jgi:hypothetical protein